MHALTIPVPNLIKKKKTSIPRSSISRIITRSLHSERRDAHRRADIHCGAHRRLRAAIRTERGRRRRLLASGATADGSHGCG